MISIIVSAHNEEKNIKNILGDIKREVNNVAEKVELIVSLSGCTDNTELFAKEELKNYGPNYKILKTRLGKINSQKDTLKKVNKSSEFIIFIDCDIRLKNNAIKNIIADARKYTDVKLFYSSEIPIKRKSLFYNIINVRTINPEYVVAREDVSKFHPYNKNKRRKIFATGGMYLIRKGVYDIDNNSIGDDSYLTHSIYFRFGCGSIKQTKSAIIYYQPVYTFSSWINKWRRIWGDINNLYAFHPEFRYLEKYMKLKIDFLRLFKDRKYKLVFFFFMERSWDKIGGFIFKKFFLNKKKDWKQLSETKEIRLK